ncbi:SRPBCC domain-containing protein [Bacteriovorax stolpii]|uniref:ATPase n=1 Tax=Bacteriovorax stolpii TaxID=960 RepID=A0A2K9NPE0_BACTC|nr:SRPBCC domain-containing protein [Bacteriovorax stolpii]AUN97379.1 ATPase [Bacteriovorax stolpii]QDK42651.1 SRPBCC domain-containing protein [Bacteriovorax stolpii]TDP52552.1 uncharacterized protein YndB with AHSA1/START domain [Bacteriovorax stolpii]
MTQTTDKSDTTSGQFHSHFNTPFVEVTKNFNAPIENVWKAWSDPEMVKQWWGPQGFSCPHAELDFRIDGKYLIAMEDSGGQVVWSTGTYKEIFPNELIVCTDQFADKNGRPISAREAGMGGAWENAEETLIYSVKFTSLGENKTEIQLVHEGIPASEHDECVSGWSSSLDKMKKLLENN